MLRQKKIPQTMCSRFETFFFLPIHERSLKLGNIY
jgi:hypothetical protein